MPANSLVRESSGTVVRGSGPRGRGLESDRSPLERRRQIDVLVRARTGACGGCEGRRTCKRRRRTDRWPGELRSRRRLRVRLARQRLDLGGGAEARRLDRRRRRRGGERRLERPVRVRFAAEEVPVAGGDEQGAADQVAEEREQPVA